MSIFLKMLQKYQVDKKFSPESEQYKIMKDFAQFSKDIVMEIYQQLSLTEACMLAKAFTIFDIINVGLITKLLSVQRENYPKAKTKEIYGLLDATLEAYKNNFNEMGEAEVQELRMLCK